jgi:hypothetical protein
LINYILNDITTPNLVEAMKAPKAPATPMYAVQHYAGGGFKRGTKEALAANCHVTIANVLNFFDELGLKASRWAGTSNLRVLPRAGKKLNAYYDRRSLCFFYFSHRRLNGTVFTSESSDIVAHELGHALLDTFRPDTWGAASLEVWSFHEAFADLTAMLNIMSYDQVLTHALAQTNGNLRKPNVISNLAEQVGNAIFKFSPPGSGRSPHCLRSAINRFKYVNPGRLPKKAPHNKLAAECHSFGRVFLGAYYDIMVGIYEKHVSEEMEPLEALKLARTALAKRALRAVLHAGVNVRFYNSMAKTMLWVDKTQFSGAYLGLMRKVFIARKLIQPKQLQMLSAPPCDNDEGVVRIQSKFNLKLADHVMRAQSNSNPLYDVELEIPHEQVYLYDNDKNIMDAITVTNDEALAAAQDMVHYLNDANLVSDEPDTPFEIRDGKLVRTHFSQEMS